MSEIIDSFRPPQPEGRGKAITLFVLTTIGSFAKLVFVGIWLWLIFALQDAFGGGPQPKEIRWIIFVGFLVIVFGLLNFVGSLLMLKRIKAGLWLYLASQILNILILTFSLLVTSSKIETGGIFFLGIVLIVTGIFVALYFSNMAYYDSRRPVDDRFFEDTENAGPGNEFRMEE